VQLYRGFSNKQVFDFTEHHIIMSKSFHIDIGGRRATFQMRPYLIVAAAALTLAYTIIGWDDPTLGLHKTLYNKGDDFGLAVAIVVVNSLVAVVALSNLGSIAELASGGKSVGIKIGLSLASAILLGSAAVSIANASTIRKKRGDALGISAVVLSSLSVIGPLILMLGGAQNILKGLIK
jgi:hypothetical protein